MHDRQETAESAPYDSPGRAGGRRVARALTALLLLVAATGLVPGWIGLEIWQERALALARLQSGAAAVAPRVADLANRFRQATDPVTSLAVTAENRIGLTAQLLKALPAIAPASGLWVYSAQGRFVAASQPLLPGEESVAAASWFRSALAPAPDPTTLRAYGAADGSLVLLRPIADRAGTVTAVVGTTVPAPAMASLLRPASLPATARVDLLPAQGSTALLSLAPLLTPGAEANRAPNPGETPWSSHAGATLRGLMARFGTSDAVAVETTLAPLPLRWQVRWAFLDSMGTERAAEIMWPGFAAGAAALALAWIGLRLLFAAGLRHAGGAAASTPSVPAGVPAGPGPGGAASEWAWSDMAGADWGWEIDHNGRLIGVTGAAPDSIAAASGGTFTSLASEANREGWARFDELIRRRADISNLDLDFIVASGSGLGRRRFRLSGWPIAATGGYWGIAREIPPQSQTGPQRQEAPSASARAIRAA